MCKNLIRRLFLTGVAAIQPGKLISSVLKVEKDHVIINSRKYNLSNGKCYIIGFGKAVTDMAFKAEAILNSKLHKGILSIPYGMSVTNKDFTKLKIYQGAYNNIPDENSLKATEDIVKLAKEATENDLVLVLISGGGSALLSKPNHGIELEDKINLIKTLVNAGADIKELNCVRKRISDVKGGKLANYIYPARSVSFILSDIVGDPLDLIASGPTVQNTEPNSKALDILEKYNLLNDKYERIVHTIKNDSVLDNKIFVNSNYIILANNRVALEAIKERASKEGYVTIILSSSIEGNVDKVSRLYAKLAHLTYEIMSKSCDTGEYVQKIDSVLLDLGINENSINDIKSIISNDVKKICFLFGGETVVNVEGKGLGGRNQELALRFSTEFDLTNADNLQLDKNKVLFLSGGTDGIDGPTDAAGAIAYTGQSFEAKQQGLNPQKYLNDNDSYNYFKQLNDSEDLIKIGHTGVNVMDLHILLINR